MKMLINENKDLIQTNSIELNSFTLVSDKYFYQNNYSEKSNSLSSIELLVSKKIEKANLLEINKKENIDIDNLKGSIFIFISILIFSFNNLIGKILGLYLPEIENSVVNLIRGIIVLIICLFIVIQKNIQVTYLIFSKPKSKIFFLFLRCFAGSMANYLILESLKYLRVSSAFTIYNLAPIIAFVLSVFYLKIKFSNLDIFSFVICFFSLILITKPEFIFEYFINDFLITNKGEDKIIGVIICLVAAISSGISIFINKMISKDFDDIIQILLFGLFFILESSIAIPFSKNGFSTFNLLGFFLAFLIGIFYFFHVTFFIRAIKISNPAKVLPVSYVGVVLTFIYNIFIFKQSCDFLDILGSSIIIFVNIYKICNQNND